MTEAQQRETRLLFEYASRCAEQFVSLYYSASDSPSRSQLLPTLYLDTSTVVWNGNPIQGVGGLTELIARMPFTRYEIQGVDCHPLGGGNASTTAGDANGLLQPPSLLLTVSGIVTHHTPSSYTALPPSNAPSSSNNNKKSSAGAYDSNVPLESLPRGFSQNFVLVDDSKSRGEGGVVVSMDKEGGQTMTGRYFVFADEFRFIG